jgi:hypothetical protein
LKGERYRWAGLNAESIDEAFSELFDEQGFFKVKADQSIELKGKVAECTNSL